MNNFTLVENSVVSEIEKKLPFFVNSEHYLKLDDDEKRMTGIVVSTIANLLNENEISRCEDLDLTLSLLEELSNKDANFQDYVVTEFFENIRFEVIKLDQFPVLNRLYSQYMVLSD